MHTLYPCIKPNKTYQFPVEEPHILYLEEAGNPEGQPVIVLHSGPGAGGDCNLRRYFDPQHYRIIIFDQRGCGRSTPHAVLTNNTTHDLVADIESIRQFLDIDKAILFGGGFGSLLALLYAQQYPKHVKAMLLHQIFLGRQQDIDWFYKRGTSHIYPDYWLEFTATVPEESDIPQQYSIILQGENELARMSAAKNWALWQARCSSLQPHSIVLDQYSDLHFALSLAMLESHYVNNHYFIKENQALEHIDILKNIPCYLVHGRYDMVCPLSGAWVLHQALPSSNLGIVRDAGHSEKEAGMIDAIIHASKELVKYNHQDAS